MKNALKERQHWLFNIMVVGLMATNVHAADFKGVKTLAYQGWSNCLSIGNGKVELIICGDIGGRIIHYSLEDENILWQDKKLYGQTAVGGDLKFSPGGYQLDVIPIDMKVNGYPELWSGQYETEITGDYEVLVKGNRKNPMGIALDKRIKLDPVTGIVKLVQRLTNISDKDVCFSLWDRTWTKSPNYAFFPLREKSIYPDKWDFPPHVKKWGPEAIKKIQDIKQYIIKDGIFFVDPKGVVSQIVADCDRGMMGWMKGDLVYLKRFAFDEKEKYSFDGGGNVSIFTSDDKMEGRMLEMEIASPQYALKPGEAKTYEETWELYRFREKMDTFKKALALAKDEVAKGSAGRGPK